MELVRCIIVNWNRSTAEFPNIDETKRCDRPTSGANEDNDGE